MEMCVTWGPVSISAGDPVARSSALDHPQGPSMRSSSDIAMTYWAALRRGGDDGARDGPSSLQWFAGEDLRCAERRQASQAENQAAWAAQHAAREDAKAAAAADDKTASQLVSFCTKCSSDPLPEDGVCQVSCERIIEGRGHTVRQGTHRPPQHTRVHCCLC